MKTFEQENNEILTSVLKNTFFASWKNLNSNEKDWKKKSNNIPGLELYLTPDCSQNCSYCYLCKYKNDLYPEELRNEETILSNLKIVLDYLVENKLNPPRFDLFSGDIWDTQFGLDALDAVIDAVKRGFKPGMFMIPSNCAFVLNEEALTKIEERMQALQDLNIRLAFSCSNDGLLIDAETRPFTEETNYSVSKGSKEYYDLLFNFCKKWHLGFHPMVSAHGIEKWKENYKWWMDELTARGFDPLNSIMFLETRNDDWTDEKIKCYLEYLNFSIDYFKSGKITTPCYPEYDADKLFHEWRMRRLQKLGGGHYSPLTFGSKEMTPGCTIHRSLVIRLGDLAIVPCHRTSYEEFLIGKINVNENKEIIGVTAKNISMMNQVWLNNMLGNAKCGSCLHRTFCIKGCYGAQFESNGDMFYPCESVCELYKAKNIFLYHKLMKVDNLGKENQDKLLVNVINSIKETEEYAKWSKIALEII